ncbi:zinc finger C2H2 type AN1-like family protein, partial [Prunus dulcis]
PATAGPETGPVRLASSPDQACPFSPSETTISGRELDWFEPELFRRRAAASAAQTRRDFYTINGSYLEIGVSTARTQQAGPSRGQAAWDYLGDSAKILVESLEF